MPSSINEFRQHIYKEVLLPSGLTATIRKVQQWDLLGGEELPMPRGGLPTAQEGEGQDGDAAPLSPEALRYLRRMGDRMIARGTVAPALTDTRDDGGEPVMLSDKLHVTELLQEDYAALLMAIREWCGLTQEDGQAVEAFRLDPLSPVSQTVGTGVSLSAE